MQRALLLQIIKINFELQEIGPYTGFYSLPGDVKTDVVLRGATPADFHREKLALLLKLTAQITLLWSARR
jgi:hypothetical protein